LNPRLANDEYRRRLDNSDGGVERFAAWLGTRGVQTILPPKQRGKVDNGDMRYRVSPRHPWQLCEVKWSSPRYPWGPRWPFTTYLIGQVEELDRLTPHIIVQINPAFTYFGVVRSETKALWERRLDEQRHLGERQWNYICAPTLPTIYPFTRWSIEWLE
jgi:hypothetical protein